MVKKMTVLAMGNQEKYNYFIIKKEEGFLEWLSKVYSESGEGISDDVFLYEEVTSYGKTVMERIDVMKLEDVHQAYSTSNGRLDVFYGVEKIFLTLYASLEDRKKFIKCLEKYSHFLG